MSDNEKAGVPSREGEGSHDEDKGSVTREDKTEDPADDSAPDLLPGSLPVDEPGPLF